MYVDSNPLRTVTEQIRVNILHFSDLMNADCYQDAVRFADDPDLFLSGLQNKIDENGNIIYRQGQRDPEGRLLTLSYATLENYETKIQNMMNFTNSRLIFEPYYAALAG